jgi:hypothetical protein
MGDLARFEARTIQNLDVTGTLRVSGRQVQTKRLYCNFAVAENTTPAPTSPPTVGSRTGIAPARLFDYETNMAFQVPATASIRGLTIVGTSENDRAILKDLRAWAQVPLGSTPGISGIALTVHRCPVPKDGVTDSVASRDPTSAMAITVDSAPKYTGTTALTAPDPSNGLWARASANVNYIFTTGTATANPYFGFYRFLSRVRFPWQASLNSHVGVTYEHADVLFKRTPSGPRFEWGSPAASDGGVVPDAFLANAGLAVALTFVRASDIDAFGTGTGGQVAPDAEIMRASVATNLGIDVIIELEFNEDATSQKRDLFATSRVVDLL